MTRHQLQEILLNVQDQVSKLRREVQKAIDSTADGEDPDDILTKLMNAETTSHQVYVELDNTFRKARKEEQQQDAATLVSLR